jgi:hypothetical protein
MAPPLSLAVFPLKVLFIMLTDGAELLPIQIAPPLAAELLIKELLRMLIVPANSVIAPPVKVEELFSKEVEISVSAPPIS